MVINQKSFFIITFGLTVLARAMTWHEFSDVPYTAIYLLFMAFWLFMAIKNENGNIVYIRDTATTCMVMLSIYYIIWGVSNITNLDFDDTIRVMLRSLMMMAFVFISSYWIRVYKCLYDVIKVTYYALMLLMVVSFFAHIREINIVRTLATFWESSEELRYRNLFGFSANNIAAEYAMSVILLSLPIYQSKPKATLNRFALLCIDFIMAVIIIANNSRGTTLALIIIAIIFAMLELIRRNSIKKVLRILGFITVGIVVGIYIYSYKYNFSIADLLEETNRSHFLDNLDALKSSGRWLMGLGRISGAYFKSRAVLYGVRLNYMEMFYMDVFITSGVIGSIWILYTIYLIFKTICMSGDYGNSEIKKWILLVFCYMLFLSLFEGYLFSYSYITATIFLIIIFSYMQIDADGLYGEILE